MPIRRDSAVYNQMSWDKPRHRLAKATQVQEADCIRSCKCELILELESFSLTDHPQGENDRERGKTRALVHSNVFVYPSSDSYYHLRGNRVTVA